MSAFIAWRLFTFLPILFDMNSRVGFILNIETVAKARKNKNIFRWQYKHFSEEKMLK